LAEISYNQGNFQDILQPLLSNTNLS